MSDNKVDFTIQALNTRLVAYEQELLLIAADAVEAGDVKSLEDALSDLAINTSTKETLEVFRTWYNEQYIEGRELPESVDEE